MKMMTMFGRFSEGFWQLAIAVIRIETKRILAMILMVVWLGMIKIHNSGYRLQACPSSLSRSFSEAKAKAGLQVTSCRLQVLVGARLQLMLARVCNACPLIARL